MDWSIPGFPILHHLPELVQTHIHCVGNAIQPSYPLSFPSPRAFSLSQHQVLFQWVSSSHQVAKVLELQLQHQSFQWIFRTDFLKDWLVWSPCNSRDFSNTTAQKHQSFEVQLSLWSNSHIHTWLLEKTIPLTRWNFVSKVMYLLFNMLSSLDIAFLPRSKHLYFHGYS